MKKKPQIQEKKNDQSKQKKRKVAYEEKRKNKRVNINGVKKEANIQKN